VGTIPEKMCYSSALERRALCPGSALVESRYPYESISSPAAAEGTMLHNCVTNVLKTGEFGHDLTEEQEEAVMYCVGQMKEYADDPENIVLSEYQLDLTEQGRLNKPRIDTGFILPGGDKIVLFEFKFGYAFTKHPRWNWQCKDYACGAWITFGAQEVEVIILQPRSQEEYQRRAYTFKTEELQNLDVEIRAVVENACRPGAPLVPGDDQCNWCRAKEECGARKSVIETIPKHMDAKALLESMPPADRYELMEKVIIAQAWLKDYRTAMDAYMLDGGEIPGWELGTTKKKSKWRDDVETVAALREAALAKGKDPEALVKPEEPVGLTAAKKVLGNSEPMKLLYDELRVTPIGEITPVRIKGFKP